MQISVIPEQGRRFFKWLNLPFADKALETEFVKYYVSGSIRVSQTLMIIGAFAYYISFISDQVMDANTGYHNHIIRGTIAVPTMLLCAMVLFLKNAWRNYENISLIYYIIPHISLCCIYVNIDKGFEHSGLAFILLLMGCNLSFTIYNL